MQSVFFNFCAAHLPVRLDIETYLAHLPVRLDIEMKFSYFLLLTWLSIIRNQEFVSISILTGECAAQKFKNLHLLS